MLVERKCHYCDGSGIRIIESSALLGILRRSLPTSCEYCHGRGSMLDVPTCRFCEGQGLIGNERETCRSCNGTGKADAFSFIPRESIGPGATFFRRCEQCGESSFEIVSDIEQHKLIRSWEADEELRHVEVVERVWVSCGHCSNRYDIMISDEMHKPIDAAATALLEELGIQQNHLRFAD